MHGSRSCRQNWTHMPKPLIVLFVAPVASSPPLPRAPTPPSHNFCLVRTPRPAPCVEPHPAARGFFARRPVDCSSFAFAH